MRFVRRLTASAAQGALVWLLAGCVTLLPRGTPLQLYRFGFLEAHDLRPETGGAPSMPLNFELRSTSLPAVADGLGILTSRGDTVAYVAGARWAAPASVLFAEAAVQAFDAGGLKLARGAAAAAADLSLEVDVFEARYVDSGAPTVVVAVRAALAEADGRPFAEQTFRVSRRADANRVSSIVTAYDRAVSDDLEAIARWSALALAQRRASAGSR